jgi:hypothetical protein
MDYPPEAQIPPVDVPRPLVRMRGVPAVDSVAAIAIATPMLFVACLVGWAVFDAWVLKPLLRGLNNSSFPVLDSRLDERAAGTGSKDAVGKEIECRSLYPVVDYRRRLPDRSRP